MSDQTEKIIGQLPTVDQQPLVCSVGSRIAGEQLFGTVSLTRIWFLLEYPSPPPAKAFEESKIPQPVKDYLSTVLKSTPKSRLLLIRQKSSFINGSGPTLFLAFGKETAPALYEYHLENYEELLNLNFTGIISDQTQIQPHRREENIFLVCTNGRRDGCCARWGVSAYEALSRLGGNGVWQSSHIGGHRFAANAISFPHGIVYGRVDQREAENLVSAYQRGQIVLANYRGRACYKPEVQAAEFYLRSQTGESQVEAYRLASSKEIEPGSWEITFRLATNETRYRLRIASGLSDYKIYESCDSAEPKAQVFYRLCSFEELSTGG